MITEGFIIELFIRIDDAMKGIRKHSQANLCPSEVVTLGILLSLKGVGNGFHYRIAAKSRPSWSSQIVKDYNDIILTREFTGRQLCEDKS